ncbi:hypothetical protein [Anaerocolumna sp. MB42-C2]|uniref:hypothetical protein n=1 Tax=Anaerocolumna sp. MB42-C2 TaxID=3070997 RepID=UPI0027E1FCCC|nr:hypothetical protein [Anaerocolumna sp. MB42-C2]WMJ85785.1 hypothetical protein RBU59_17155 [Anaerocolumna sp. MB42-C2]
MIRPCPAGVREQLKDVKGSKKVGRNLNRHYYTEAEIKQETARPVVKALLTLMRFRNNHPAFEREFLLKESNDNTLIIRRQYGDNYAELSVDFITKEWSIIYSEENQEKSLVV